MIEGTQPFLTMNMKTNKIMDMKANQILLARGTSVTARVGVLVQPTVSATVGGGRIASALPWRFIALVSLAVLPLTPGVFADAPVTVVTDTELISGFEISTGTRPAEAASVVRKSIH